MKKFLKIIAVVLILMTCLSGCANLNIKDWAVKKQAINYLCEKYDAEPDEFELLDSRKKHLAIIEDSVWPRIGMVDYAFEFQYNDRHFIVNRTNGQFYDDYQLEDIELWCTEWLQENVDPYIVGFDIWSENILKYYDITNKNFSYIITIYDAEDFLKHHESDGSAEIYYHNNTDLSLEFSDKDLSKRIDNILGLKDSCGAVYSNSQTYRTVIKPESCEWESCISDWA